MRPGAQLIYRMVDVLMGLAASNRDGIGMTDLARQTGLAGPTVHRLLQALVDVGMVYQRPEDKRYVLGSLLVELGRIAGERFDLLSISETQIEAFANKSGDTVFFLVRSGNDMHCLARASGSFPIKTLITEVGTNRPIGVGASGLAVMAAMPEQDANELLSQHAAHYLEVGRSLASVAEEVAMARISGYVVRVMPALGATTVAVAIRDKAGYPFASVSASAISQRMVGDHLSNVLKELKSIAQHIEGQIDFESQQVMNRATVTK